MFDQLIAIDTYLFLLFNRDLVHPIFDFLFVRITDSHFWIIPGLVTAAIYIRYKRKEALVVIGLMLITVAISDPVGVRIVKPLVGRLRPCNPSHWVEGGRFLIGMKGSLSFPSSHAMNVFAQAMLLTLLYPRKWVWFFVFAAAIGFSRIYVGVHYPLDVAGGAVLGCIVGVLVWRGYIFVTVLVNRKRAGNAESQRLVANDKPAHSETSIN